MSFCCHIHQFSANMDTSALIFVSHCYLLNPCTQTFCIILPTFFPNITAINVAEECWFLLEACCNFLLNILQHLCSLLNQTTLFQGCGEIWSCLYTWISQVSILVAWWLARKIINFPLHTMLLIPDLPSLLQSLVHFMQPFQVPYAARLSITCQ